MTVKKIREAAEKYPDRVAYKVGRDSLTYRELLSAADRYAPLLKRQGSAPVILYGHKETDMVIAIVACLIAGRPYVPVDVATPVFRLLKIVQMTRSTLVITNEPLSVDGADCCALRDLENHAGDTVQNGGSDIAYMIFTSGSTGEPKGVPISRANLYNFVQWISRMEPLGGYENISVFNQASFSFDLSVADLYYALCNGHTLVAYDGDVQEDYAGLFDLFGREAIRVAVMTPTFMKLCLINGEFTEKNYPALSCVYFCGEMLESRTVKALFQRFPRLQIINAYGPTEATSAVCGILITKDMAESGELLPVGETGTFATDIEIIDGEIVLKGDSVFGGYLGGDAGGFYREAGQNCYKTGDIGWIRDGRLYCNGRRDDRIKYKGYRIELRDIEQNIRQIPGVTDCAVVAGYTDAGVVKTVKAFVTAVPGVTAEAVKEGLRSRVPAYMMPKTVKILERLPVNQNGKTDRKALSKA